MYKNIWVDRDGNKIHIWDDKRGYFTDKIQKYDYCYIKDDNGDKLSIFGDRVSKITKKEARQFPSDSLFEYDIYPDMRFLIDNYHNSDEVSTDHITLDFDIEVDSSDGFPYATKALYKITAISGIYLELNKSFVLILDEDNQLPDKSEVDGTVVMSFSNESQLLLKFFEIYSKLTPTILTGWNIDDFDIPYIYNRTCKVLNEEYANQLSPIGIVKENYMNPTRYVIAGVSILDYMELYKKFAKDEQPSYKLDAIAKVELGEGKVEYEGSLYDLYLNDINKFIKYSLTDVVLIKKLNDKLDYINIALYTSHVGHIPYERVFNSSAYIEGAALTYTKNQNLVVPNKKKLELKLSHDVSANSTELKFDKVPSFISPQGTLSFKKSVSKKIFVEYYKIEGNTVFLRKPTSDLIKKEYDVMLEFEGAYVKDPITGLHRWIFDLDLKSMYPFILISLNISPETKVGRIYDYDYKKFIKDEGTFTIEYKGNIYKDIDCTKIRNLLTNKNLSLSSNGILYSMDTTGIIPTLLLEWSSKRDEYKKLRDEYGLQNKDFEYDFYDRKQYVQKILLNTFYGVLGLFSFRFYDVDNAEATTSTGKTLIKYSEQVANKYYNSIINTDVKRDHVIYIDTDSLYLSSLQIIENKYTKYLTKSEDEIIEKTIEIAREVENIINEKYSEYSLLYHGIKDHKFKIKQELVGKTGFWTGKKRYAQWIKNKEGVPKDYIDYKGLDVIRSDFPVLFVSLFDKTINNIMKGNPKNTVDQLILETLDKILNEDFIKISSSKSVNKINEHIFKYKGDKTRYPVKGSTAHLKGAIYYNNLLDYYGYSDKYSYIKSKDKIKFLYLKPNKFGYESISYPPDEIPKKIKDFIEIHGDGMTMFNKIAKNKLETYYEAMNWGAIPNKNEKNVSKFF